LGTEAAGSDVATYARHAEQCGIGSLWVGDDLIATRPVLDSTLLLAGAATATDHIKLGFGVLIAALRPAAWVGKQIATLQHLSHDRVVLGIGVGGEMHGQAHGAPPVSPSPNAAGAPITSWTCCPTWSPASPPASTTVSLSNSHRRPRCRRYSLEAAVWGCAGRSGSAPTGTRRSALLGRSPKPPARLLISQASTASDARG
jgi:hypothetical protein